MVDNAIKINWNGDIYWDYHGCKLKETNMPLNGKYVDDHYGTIYYFKNGKYHNENGPAFISDFSTTYHINGKYHRIDGPAITHSNGYHKWYINGYRVSNKKINNWLTENNIPLDWNLWTDSDKMLFALHWSDYSK